MKKKKTDLLFFFFFQAEDGIRDADVTGVQTCALPICPWLLKYSSFVTGWKSWPTLLRTPRATYSSPVPSGLIRTIAACVSGGMQMLHGAPMLKYSLPSGPNERYFQP